MMGPEPQLRWIQFPFLHVLVLLMGIRVCCCVLVNIVSLEVPGSRFYSWILMAKALWGPASGHHLILRDWCGSSLGWFWFSQGLDNTVPCFWSHIPHFKIVCKGCKEVLSEWLWNRSYRSAVLQRRHRQRRYSSHKTKDKIRESGDGGNSLRGAKLPRVTLVPSTASSGTQDSWVPVLPTDLSEVRNTVFFVLLTKLGRKTSLFLL